MACKVVGFKSGEFNDRRTGELIEFGKMYVTYPDTSVTGECCESISIKPDMLVGLSVGDEIRLDRNQYGKVISFDIV